MYLRPEHFLFAFMPLVLEALGSDWTGEKIGEKGKFSLTFCAVLHILGVGNRVLFPTSLNDDE